MKLNKIIQHELDRKLYAESSLLVSSKDFIGIEIELEQLDIQSSFYDKVRPKVFWATVHEDSVRQGGELIFKEPLCGANITAALTEYETFLRDYKEHQLRLPVISDRCSLHVHVDVRDLDVTTINTMALVYVMFEKIIFQYLNPSRYRNNYCVALGSTNFNTILADMPDSDQDQYSYIEYVNNRCDKYGSMNYLSTMCHGSLEFRGHPGTFIVEDILAWVNILLSIKLYSKELPEGITPIMLKGVSAEMMATQVFGKEAYKLMQTNFFEDNFNYGKSWVLDTLLKKEMKVNTLKSLKTKSKLTTKLIDKYKEAN